MEDQTSAGSPRVAPQVSVVLCTYNGRRFLVEQVQTILAQTVRPLEIVVSDDGSTDDTLDILAALEAGDVPVTVYRNDANLGFAENFLQACRRTRGSHIAFCDQDDLWYADKLERQLAALARHDARLCAHGVRYVDEHGRPLSASSTRSDVVLTHKTAAPWGNFLGMTMLFDRSLLDIVPCEARGLDPHAHGVALSHDRWIYFLGTSFGRTVVLRDVLADYRQHGRQLYGGERRRTLSERFMTRVSGGRDQARYLSALAAHRAALATSLRGRHEVADDLARRWTTLSRHYEARTRLLRQSSLAGRLAVLGANTVRGCYVPVRRAGLGWRGWAEDAVVAVGATFTAGSGERG